MTIPARLLQSVFNAGELAPRLRDRSDLNAYFAGADVIENMIVLREGGCIRRSGTRHVASLPARARLIAFRRSSDEAVVIAAAPNALTFYDAKTFTPLMDGESPVSVVSPWGAADLDGIYTWQSVDVLFCAHKSADFAPRALLRYADDDWSLVTHQNEYGPFLEQNTDEAITLSPSAETGAGITLTAAGGDVFHADQVGAEFRILEGPEAEDYSTWQAEESVDANSVRAYGSNVYQATANATTGNRPPVHLSGTVRDGQSGAFFAFLHDKSGLVKITAVASATSATADVIERLPGRQSGKGHPYFAEGAFSDYRGWPRLGLIFEERLWYFSTRHQPDTAFASRQLGYGPTAADFKPGAGDGEVVDTDAIVRTFADGQLNRPAWAVAREAIYVGTPTGVKRISGPYTDEPITPAGTIARQVNDEPCHPEVRALITGGPDRLVYPSYGGHRLIEMAFDGETDDLTARAEHVFQSPCAELAWAGEPHRRLYARTKAGELRVLTYDRKQNVVGWARLVLGGSWKGGAPVVESLVTALDETGEERLWLVVRRTIDGEDAWSLEVLEPDWRSAQHRLDEAVFMDAAVIVDLWNTDTAKTITAAVTDPERGDTVSLSAAGHSPFAPETVGEILRLRRTTRPPRASDAPGDLEVKIVTADGASATAELITDPAPGQLDAPLYEWAWTASEITGLDHLEGESVSVLADGMKCGPLTVEGGAITLPGPFARAAAGLKAPWRGRSMPIVSGTPLGTSTGQPIRVEKMHVGFVDALDASVRVILEGRGKRPEPLVVRSNENRHGAAVPARTGRREVLVNAGFGDEAQVEVFGDGPYPFTLTSVTAEVRLDP